MEEEVFQLINISVIEQKLIQCWSHKTSSRYSEENPYKGQCSVTAIVIHEILGGEILKTRVGNQWHYYNFINGQRIDFTKKQFEFEIKYQDILSNSIDAFTDTSIVQYISLKEKLLSILYPEIELQKNG